MKYTQQTQSKKNGADIIKYVKKVFISFSYNTIVLCT